VLRDEQNNQLAEKSTYQSVFLISGSKLFLKTLQTSWKIVSENIFKPVLSQYKKYHSSGNLIFNNSGIFQSLKFRI